MIKPGFTEKVWLACSEIPKGKLTTYGQLAIALNKPKAFRAVGNALNKNPNAPHVPCHRVIASNGALGGYAFGLRKKTLLLKKEGIKVKNNKVLNLESVLITGKDLKKWLH